ncbi:MAG: hypothetical protein AMJ92_08730 [candidate division Zixibacteria bacterium SM23_81]|nr:MAG: hypothetical protein AMJ92_08730 [candidate division Zixibacteria bacterium SM23_81]
MLDTDYHEMSLTFRFEFMDLRFHIKTKMKFTVLIILISVLLLLIMEIPTTATPAPKFGFRLGTGLLWAPEDKKDLDGERLYRQHYPFFVEVFYGGSIRGLLGLSHIFSQEREHVGVDSLGEEKPFTPKLRQYAIHLGAQASRRIKPRFRVYGGIGAAVFWRSYNPGWKDKSNWDKTRLGALGMAGTEVKLGPKAWLGLGWRYYTTGWRKESRWTTGEYNRMRRMSVFSMTMSYSPGRW